MSHGSIGPAAPTLVILGPSTWTVLPPVATCDEITSWSFVPAVKGACFTRTRFPRPLLAAIVPRSAATWSTGLGRADAAAELPSAVTVRIINTDAATEPQRRAVRLQPVPSRPLFSKARDFTLAPPRRI